jgi:pyruvate dehydrogenase E2 component (dihydrolipoamide acetyltransferase)
MAEMKQFRLPDLGEGLTEAEIVTWHVGVGDHVSAGQPLVSVETDKAVVEVPSPRSGRIARRFGEAGELIEIGAVLVEFGEGEAGDTGTVVGEIPKTAAPATAAASSSAGGAVTGAPGIKATPAVRALARRHGIDLGIVAPSGEKSQVTKADVERAAKALAEAGPPQRLRGVRRAMARRMARAQAEVAATTVTDEADVGDWPEAEDTTIRLIRAIAAGCAAEPSLNAWFDGATLSRRLPDKVNIGIATDTPDGLFVPVLRDAGNRDAPDLRRGLEAMKADIKARSVPPEELRGQTITLSNFGTIGGRHAALIVVPPQVAILGAGRIEPRVVAQAGKPVVRRTLPLSLTFDHRAVSGGEAARFLAAVKANLEEAD